MVKRKKFSYGPPAKHHGTKPNRTTRFVNIMFCEDGNIDVDLDAVLFFCASRESLDYMKCAVYEGNGNINAVWTQGSVLTYAMDRGDQDIIDFLKSEGAV